APDFSADLKSLSVGKCPLKPRALPACTVTPGPLFNAEASKFAWTAVALAVVSLPLDCVGRANCQASSWFPVVLIAIIFLYDVFGATYSSTGAFISVFFASP